jgi:DNA-binding NtrC family response regulator
MENNPPPSPSKPVVAVCGAASSELDELAEKVRGLGAWDAVLVRWPNARALEAALAAPAAGYVLVEARGLAGAELTEEIGRRAPSVPVLLVGGEPALAQWASCWLARSPSAPFLGMLLGQLIPPTVVPQRRRKRDLILGISTAIKEVFDALDRLSASYAPVLITGESGTGKELVARALHFSGPRAAYPFLAVNCAAIPESLFESELFGHTRGAFTGATAARPGVFEAAGGGTVLLDEIGEMPLAMQAKLLRVLETGEITRLGTTESRRVDVRIVAATNRDLEEEVAKKRFREDLYYRIRVYPLVLPPLRERPSRSWSSTTWRSSAKGSRPRSRRSPRRRWRSWSRTPGRGTSASW